MKEVLPFHAEPERWARDVAEPYSQSFSPDILISDVDDTLLGSNRAWYNDYIRLAMDAGVDEDGIVDFEAFSLQGPRIILTEHHGLIDPNEYPAYKHGLMRSPTFHKSIRPLDDAANALASENFTRIPGGYISTRPVVLGSVTRQSLLTSAHIAPSNYRQLC